MTGRVCIPPASLCLTNMATHGSRLRQGIIHDGERVPLKSVKAVYLLYGDTVSVLKK